MIDATTRAAWRRVWTEATHGPWAAHDDGSTVTTTDGGLVLRTRFSDGADARLAAQAREGWPRTMAELEAAELACRHLVDDLERMSKRAHDAEMDRAAMHLDVAVAVERAGIHERARQEAELACLKMAGDRAEMQDRVKHLEDALAAWKRHRHAPTLVAAMDAYERMNP